MLASRVVNHLAAAVAAMPQVSSAKSTLLSRRLRLTRCTGTDSSVVIWVVSPGRGRLDGRRLTLGHVVDRGERWREKRIGGSLSRAVSGGRWHNLYMISAAVPKQERVQQAKWAAALHHELWSSARFDDVRRVLTHEYGLEVASLLERRITDRHVAVGEVTSMLLTQLDAWLDQMEVVANLGVDKVLGQETVDALTGGLMTLCRRPEYAALRGYITSRSASPYLAILVLKTMPPHARSARGSAGFMALYNTFGEVPRPDELPGILEHLGEAWIRGAIYKTKQNPIVPRGRGRSLSALDDEPAEVPHTHGLDLAQAQHSKVAGEMACGIDPSNRVSAQLYEVTDAQAFEVLDLLMGYDSTEPSRRSRFIRTLRRLDEPEGTDAWIYAGNHPPALVDNSPKDASLGNDTEH